MWAILLNLRREDKSSAPKVSGGSTVCELKHELQVKLIRKFSFFSSLESWFLKSSESKIRNGYIQNPFQCHFSVQNSAFNLFVPEYIDHEYIINLQTLFRNVNHKEVMNFTSLTYAPNRDWRIWHLKITVTVTAACSGPVMSNFRGKMSQHKP